MGLVQRGENKRRFGDTIRKNYSNKRGKIKQAAHLQHQLQTSKIACTLVHTAHREWEWERFRTSHTHTNFYQSGVVFNLRFHMISVLFHLLLCDVVNEINVYFYSMHLWLLSYTAFLAGATMQSMQTWAQFRKFFLFVFLFVFFCLGTWLLIVFSFISVVCHWKQMARAFLPCDAQAHDTCMHACIYAHTHCVENVFFVYELTVAWIAFHYFQQLFFFWFIFSFFVCRFVSKGCFWARNISCLQSENIKTVFSVFHSLWVILTLLLISCRQFNSTIEISCTLYMNTWTHCNWDAISTQNISQFKGCMIANCGECECVCVVRDGWFSFSLFDAHFLNR